MTSRPGCRRCQSKLGLNAGDANHLPDGARHERNGLTSVAGGEPYYGDSTRHPAGGPAPVPPITELTRIEPIHLERLARQGVFTTGLFLEVCLLYTSPSPRDRQKSRMPSSA